jgi:rare lipoprotein A
MPGIQTVFTRRLFFRRLFIFFFIILLSSCSHVKKRDGAPNFYVDETRIPNAVPKAEPRAKYGNYKSYVVFGKRYYTLKSSQNYDEVGTASWYGTMFHDRKTSSGEMYSMLGMTAAHKTLPLPTYVEVTNLKNNRRIIVKVNDRGPFATNRIIDLSYVGAKKLGMLGHGTAQVRVRALDPGTFNTHAIFAQSRPSKPFHENASFQENESFSEKAFFSTSKPSSRIAYPKHLAANKHFTANKRLSLLKNTSASVFLQVGAFHDKSRALRLQQRLSAFSSAPVNVISNGSLYKVKMGPFRDNAALNTITQHLKGMGITPNKTYG